MYPYKIIPGHRRASKLALASKERDRTTEMCFVFLCDEEERELGRQQASGSCPHWEAKYRPWILKAGGGSVSYPFATRIKENTSALCVPGGWSCIHLRTQQLASHLPWRSMNIPIKMAASLVKFFSFPFDFINDLFFFNYAVKRGVSSFMWDRGRSRKNLPVGAFDVVNKSAHYAACILHGYVFDSSSTWFSLLEKKRRERCK